MPLSESDGSCMGFRLVALLLALIAGSLILVLAAP